jgi:tetratricopeptide (TPR) repeat protein
MANIDTQVFNDLQVRLDDLKLNNLNLDFQINQDAINRAVENANRQVAQADARAARSLALQTRPIAMPAKGGGDDSMYQRGLSAIDAHQYDQALQEFTTVVNHNGPRTEGGLYWKAYVLNKLGRAADAQAAIDSLRKTYPNSRWLEDTKALELEVKQSKGPVSPESETDEDIKVLALSGLMQSDPEKYLPQLDILLKGSHSPNLKRQALYVLAQNNSPKAQQMLEQIARGGNPDLQVRAIQFMSQRRNTNTPQILLEIYTSTSDPAVKRAILDTFSNSRDKDRLMQVLKGEKDASLRGSAIQQLGNFDGQPELWQIYQSETTPEGKMAVLNAMARNGNLEKLAEVARTDKEPRVRQKAIEIISQQDAGNPSDTLVALYSSEQDEKVKQTIIDHLASGGRGRNATCKPLVDVAKSEKNLQLKLRIVQRLSNMTSSCPAASEYLTELLK